MSSWNPPALSRRQPFRSGYPPAGRVAVEGGLKRRLPATKFIQETRKSPTARRRFALRGVRAGNQAIDPGLVKLADPGANRFRGGHCLNAGRAESPSGGCGSGWPRSILGRDVFGFELNLETPPMQRQPKAENRT
ncbi:MAG: hypothetical protein M2R46_03362 [Verrucomicrobia subdivision 3 bacterium]|nr:hypothetical protein [Limisphaerales bacterium]